MPKALLHGNNQDSGGACVGVWGVGGDPQAWAGWEAWHGLNRADERINEPRTHRRSNLPKTPAVTAKHLPYLADKRKG